MTVIPVEELKKRPDWLRVRVPTGENYEELKALMRGKGSIPSVRRRLPQHRRMLEPPHGHLHDSGRALHAPLRVLRRRHGRPQQSIGRSRSASRKPRSRWA